MEMKTFDKGQWLITEDVPAYFIYRLKKGRVSIHWKGKKVGDVEVAEGKTPRLIGNLGLFSNERKHTASIKAETAVEVEPIYIDHLLGLIKNETPQRIKSDVEAVIESIRLMDTIRNARERLTEIGKIKLTVQVNAKGELLEAFDELIVLYQRLYKESNA